MTRTVYRTPTAIGVRGVGFGAAGLGVATVAGTVVSATDLPGWLATALFAGLGLLAAVALLVLIVGGLRVAGRGTRLVLDDDGFVNATGFGIGERRGHWRDVRKVQTDGRFVSVDLAGGKQSLIRTSAIEVEPRELARELRARLNTNRGYRPLNLPDEQSPAADVE